MPDQQSWVTFLGTCGNQTADREATSLGIATSGGQLLVDAGPGVTRQIYRSGGRPVDYDTIVLTHQHGDHTAGFPYVVWSRFYDMIVDPESTSSSPLRVLGLSTVIEAARRNLEAAYDVGAFPFAIEYEPIEPDKKRVVDLPGAMLSFCLVDHSVPNLGVRVDTEAETSIAYSSDTRYSASFVDLAVGCNLMVHEAFVTTDQADLANRTGHSTAQEAGAAAKRASAAQLATVHIFPPLIPVAWQLAVEAAEAYGADVWMPSDLAVASLSQA